MPIDIQKLCDLAKKHQREGHDTVVIMTEDLALLVELYDGSDTGKVCLRCKKLIRSTLAPFIHDDSNEYHDHCLIAVLQERCARWEQRYRILRPHLYDALRKSDNA